MLIRLAILGLLLTATYPIPGQTANNPASSSGNVQHQQRSGKSDGQPAVSPLPQNSARPASNDTKKPNAENTGNSVTVSKLPTVSIGKDWADWSYWGFGGLLVIVGGSQVLFLYRTLKAIQTQAGHMERQTKALEDSVAAAQKSADAALAQIEIVKAKERAQFRIDFAAPEWTYSEELGGYPIHYRITLDGTTRAYILGASILAYIARTSRKVDSPSMDLGLPRDFTPDMSPFEGHILVRTFDGMPEPESDGEKIQLAEENKLVLFIDGSIYYRDVFMDEWILQIDRYWSPWSKYQPGAEGGIWAPVGSGRFNTHRKAGTYKESEPQKPN